MTGRNVEKDGAVELYPKNVHRAKNLDIHQSRVRDQYEVILTSLAQHNRLKSSATYLGLYLPARLFQRTKVLVMSRLTERLGKIGGKQRVLAGALALSALIFVGVAVAWSNTRPRTFTGEIQDSTCAGTAGHIERECALLCVHRGAKWVLYDSLHEKIYHLDDQERLGKFAAQQVTIMGGFDKSTGTIHVAKITPH